MTGITLAELRNLNPRDFDDRELSEEEILEWFDACDAY